MLILFAQDENSLGVRVQASQDSIKNQLLNNAPLNSSADDVLTFVNDRLRAEGQKPAQYNLSTGALRLQDWWDSGEKSMENWIIGSRSIKVHLGQYRALSSFFLFRVSVSASWGFDETDRLIGLYVHKEGDTF